MGYIIANSNNKYIKINSDDKKVITDNIDEVYMWEDKNKCENVKAVLPRKYSNMKMKVKEYFNDKVSKEYFEKIELLLNDLTSINVEEVKQLVLNNIVQSKLYIQKLNLEISNLNSQTQILLHFTEDVLRKNIENINYYKYFKSIQDVRNKRRILKNKLFVAEKIMKRNNWDNRKLLLNIKNYIDERQFYSRVDDSFVDNLYH